MIFHRLLKNKISQALLHHCFQRKHKPPHHHVLKFVQSMSQYSDGKYSSSESITALFLLLWFFLNLLMAEWRRMIDH